MTARATGRHRLDIEVTPTPAKVSECEVADALWGLNVDANASTVKQITNSALGPILVALVKHMAGKGGFYSAIALDDPSGLFEDAEVPPSADAPHPGRFPLR